MVEHGAENAAKQLAIHAAESVYKQQFARILEQRLAAGVTETMAVQARDRRSLIIPVPRLYMFVSKFVIGGSGSGAGGEEQRPAHFHQIHGGPTPYVESCLACISDQTLDVSLVRDVGAVLRHL